jgi:hypothetical protein
MANTFVQIGSTVTVGAGGAGFVEFTSIPATYTDLVVLYSLKTPANTEGMYVQFNGSTANFVGTYIYADGTNALAGTLARYVGSISSASDTFTNGQLYILNYAGSNNKSFSVDETYGTNTTPGFTNFTSGLWSQSAAITSIRIEAASNLAQYSSATLYGIKNS